MAEIQETQSKRWPELSVFKCGGDYFLILSGEGSLQDRLLTGISKKLVRAALEALDEDAKDYWKWFFEMNLFAHLLEENQSVGGQKVWRNRKQNLKDLQRLAKRMYADVVVGRPDEKIMHADMVGERSDEKRRHADMVGERSDEKYMSSDELAQVNDETRSLAAIEQLAWGYFFDLPSLDRPSVEDKYMGLFSDKVINAWRKSFDNETGEPSFSAFFSRLLESDFTDIDWPQVHEQGSHNGPPDPGDVYRAWVACALRFSAEHIGNTAIATVEECIGASLSDSARAVLQRRYGRNPLAGGASLAFAALLLKSDKDMREAAGVLIDSLQVDIENNPAVKKLGSQMLRYAVLGIDQYEEEAAKRERKRRNRAVMVEIRRRGPKGDFIIDNESNPSDDEINVKPDDFIRGLPRDEQLEAVPARRPIDPDESRDIEKALFEKALLALNVTDRRILELRRDGLKPSAIAEECPDLGMNGKAISDRLRKIKNRLAGLKSGPRKILRD